MISLDYLSIVMVFFGVLVAVNGISVFNINKLTLDF